MLLIPPEKLAKGEGHLERSTIEVPRLADLAFVCFYNLVILFLNNTWQESKCPSLRLSPRELFVLARILSELLPISWMLLCTEFVERVRPK